jgi:hypothetical protein
MRRCLACSASSHDRGRAQPGQLSCSSIRVRELQRVSLGSVRLLPDSFRPPVLARPPRDPILALPPRDGRALSRRMGVLGAMMSRGDAE